MSPPVPGNASAPKKPAQSRWLLIAAILLIVVGVTGFILQQLQLKEEPIELASVSATPALVPEAETESESEPEPPRIPPAAGFMVIVSDPARAEIFINDKSIGTSPQRVETNQLNFPIFVKARLADGRETSEALTQPTDLFELRLPPPQPSAVTPGPYRTAPSTARSAPATKGAASSSKPAASKPASKPSESASKPPAKSKPKSSFPALDSL